MIRKATEKVKRVLDRTNKPPLFILRIYKRHVFIALIVVWLAIMAYGTYFKFFMVLPQSTASIMPQLSLSLENQRILVFSPHCDDETLGSAGLIQQAKSKNSQIKIVMVTDCNSKKIGTTRRQESIDAVSEFGLSSGDIVFLNFPEKDRNDSADGNLATAIDKQISDFQPTLIISPHPDDTHIDHKYTGRAIRDYKMSEKTNANIIYYLIHYNFMHYPSPSGLHTDYYLLPPVRLISHSQNWYVLPLSQDQEEVKQNAVLKYKSQLSLKNPILHEILLDFVRKNELFMMEDS